MVAVAPNPPRIYRYSYSLLRPGLPVRLWMWLEGLLARLGGRNANLFAWSGPLAVACFLLIAVSGLYLFLFYQVGSEAGYASVVAIDGSALGRSMRAVHRYASRGFLLFTLLHALRYLVTGRFRGARWLPWITGLILTALIWFVGLTGYLLVWDTRAFLASEVLAGWLDALGVFGQPISFSLLSVASLKENVFLILLYLHITLPILGLIVGWLHLTRLSRPRLLPPWALASAAIVLYAALSFALPLERLPEADPSKVPAGFPIDPLYLAYLLVPRGLHQWWAVALGAFWIGVLVVLPWVGRKRSTVRVDEERCTGCGFCAADCPFGAMRLQPREGSSHSLATVVSNRCTSCGVCVGSCPTGGIDLLWDDHSFDAHLREAVDRILAAEPSLVVVRCPGVSVPQNPWEAVLEVSCAAALPLWVTRALARRGIAVRLDLCGENVCLARDGADFALRRAQRARYPYWPRKLAILLAGRIVRGTRVLPIALSTTLVAAVLLASVWEGPVWRGPNAVVKVALRAEAPFLWSRSLSASEKERLLPHMRTDQPVAGERADLKVNLVLGDRQEEWVLRAVGLHRDGPTYAYFEVPVVPGAYDASFVVQPLGVEQGPLVQWEGPLTVREGDVRVLSFGVLGPDLVIR